VTKLIEIALPIEAISAASKAEKDKKTGTIRNVHKWFAPMPLPAWRALLFAAIVDDPGDEEERKKLLDLVTRLVPPGGGPPPEEALAAARRLIVEASGGDLPTVLDPFCGGGSTLVEAQRLGLPAVGSDLNPVPALITRVLIELVPKVAGRGPIVGDPTELGKIAGGPLDGFLADLRCYAERVRERVWDEIGHLYPPGPNGETVVAWLWARTVTCPNPACRAAAPLVGSFWLSKKKGANAWVEPIVLDDRSGTRFEVRTGSGSVPAKTVVSRTAAKCAICGGAIPLVHVRAEGKAGRMGTQLMAVVLDENGSRSYRAPQQQDAETAGVQRPDDAPELLIPEEALGFRVQLYGAKAYADIFTNRQLVALSAFADAVADVHDEVRADGGDDDYSCAITSVLGLCVGKLAQANSTQVRWNVRSTGSSKAEPAFSRHALPMVWDFAEVNPFSTSVGSWTAQLDTIPRGLAALPAGARPGRARACDVRDAALLERPGLVATDPPYFKQIGYADLSDYFYVWLRRALRAVQPDLFATVATPKDAELIAAPHRHDGDSEAARRFFVEGYVEAFRSLRPASRPDLPILVVYAHRQEEGENGELVATAWDAMLSAILEAGLRIVGTWPIHGTREARQIELGTNALASYVILVCRPKPGDAKVGDLQGFVSALRAELPRAIRRVQEASISAIDLGQAAIGPGMAIFSRFSYVVDPQAGGKPMSVHRALELIDQVRAEVLDDFVGTLDPETRFAMRWFRDYGFAPGPFGEAEKLFTTVNTSAEQLERAGIAKAAASKVRLLSRDELPRDWVPEADARRPEWEILLHLIKRLEEGGETAAAALLRRVPEDAEAVKELAYWVVDKCQYAQAAEVGAFDALITSWPQLAELAAREEPGEPIALDL
jgi:putative DNA methylase